MQTKVVRFSTREMTAVSIFAACIAVMTQIIIPGPVPFSMGIFAVMLCAVVLPLKLSFCAVLIYLLIGAVGAPVFTGFSGGFQKLTGPTGGYLIGYVALVAVTALIEGRKSGIFRTVAALMLGTASCYAFGTAWLAAGLGYSFSEALSIGVLPFVLPDLLKAVAAAILGQRLRVALRHASLL